MNKAEHLLTCLAEECAEIHQAVSKALRFGIDDKYKETTPRQDIESEFTDLVAIVELLEEEGIMTIGTTQIEIDQKKARVRKYMDYAREHGTLT